MEGRRKREERDSHIGGFWVHKIRGRPQIGESWVVKIKGSHVRRCPRYSVGVREN